jgi:metal-dependent amidase/aminoacylase/carboxypeptidase family protein
MPVFLGHRAQALVEGDQSLGRAVRRFCACNRGIGLDRRGVATNIAAAHQCVAEVAIRAGYPVTVNDPAFVDFARGVATDLIGADNYINLPAPFMGAEDFSYVLQRMPGCVMFLGVMPERHDGQGHDGHDHVASCHSNRMILNEDAMAVGIAMHAAVAHRFLTEGMPG